MDEWQHVLMTRYPSPPSPCIEETYHAVICPNCEEAYELVAAHFVSNKKGYDYCPRCGKQLSNFYSTDAAFPHKRMVEVPCNVGDRVYCLTADKSEVFEATVVSIYLHSKQRHVMLNRDNFEGFEARYFTAKFGAFGTMIFFDYDEAVEALMKFAENNT